MPASPLHTSAHRAPALPHAWPQEHPTRVNACPQAPLLQAARGGAEPAAQAPWLLCAQRNEVDVWQLPASAAPVQAQVGPPAEGILLSPSTAPVHLLRLLVQSGRHVAAAALSPCGRWLAYSDAQRVSAFALEEREADEVVPDDHVMPEPLSLPADLPPACHLAFRPGTAQLVAAAADGTLRLVDLAALPPAASGGAPPEDAVQALRAVHDLQYKSSLRRDRQRSAARRLMPLVELMAVSPDGRCARVWRRRGLHATALACLLPHAWLTGPPAPLPSPARSWLAAVVRQRLHLVSLTSSKLAHSLPPLAEPQPAITAVAFTADSTQLVAAAASHQLGVYSVASGQPSEWMQAHGGSLPSKLLRMPGAIAGIASSPAAPASLFLASSEACCHLDLGQPVDGGGEGEGGGRKRRRQKPALASEPPGGNCRMIYCSDPVLHAAYLGPEALLVVERAWADVHKSITAPLYRHRYGT